MGRLEPAFGDGVFHLGKKYADILRAVHAAEAGEQIFFAITKFAIEKDEAFRAVIACVDGLGDELRMRG